MTGAYSILKRTAGRNTTFDCAGNWFNWWGTEGIKATCNLGDIGKFDSRYSVRYSTHGCFKLSQ
jgi:hypothetical protein